MKQPTTSERAVASQIRNLESGYCNPRKFSEAAELRADLRQRGYSDAEINQMAGRGE